MEKLYTWGGRLHLGTEAGGTVTTRCGKRKSADTAISFGKNVAARIEPCADCVKVEVVAVAATPVPAWIASDLEFDETTGTVRQGATVADLMRIGAAARWSL